MHLQGMVCLLLLFSLCFAVERAVCELRGRASPLLTRARWLVGAMLVGYLAGAVFVTGSYLLSHQALAGPVAQWVRALQ
jgi:hypothetical protein